MRARKTTTGTTVKRATTRAFAWMAALVLIASLFAAAAYADDGQKSSSTRSGADTALQAGDQPGSTAHAKRTILFYVCGSNLEEDAGLASENIKQVLSTNFGNGEDIRFIVMTGGSSKWYLDDDDNEENENGCLVFPTGVTVPDDAVYRYDPEEGESTDEVLNPKSQISGPYNQIWEAKSTGAADNPGKLVLLDGNGLTDSKASETEEWMSSPDTLKDFINYGVRNYPADKYDLILWDHGGGTTGGFALDFRREQNFFETNTMRFSEILDALKNSEVVDRDGNGTQDGTFDFVNFDACLMGSTEIALALADYTDYYIASPEEIPGYGERYSGWLGKLGQDPDTSTRELGTTIVDDFIDFYDAGYEDSTRDEATMAFIDTKALLRSGFVEALHTIGQALSEQAESARFYDELRSVRNSIKYQNCSYYDLGNLVSLLGITLWELDGDSVSDTSLDTNNDYTEAAKTVLDVLNNPAIVYARDTAGIQKQARFFSNAEGEITSGTLKSSGLQLYFPYNIYTKDVLDYDAEIADVIALLPPDGRTEFLASYVKAMYDFNFIQLTGKAVMTMVNLKDDAGNPEYNANDIGFAEWKEYWQRPEYPDIPELADSNEWNDTAVPLFKGMGNDDAQAGENAARDWLDNVIKQQAAEAVSIDNITAQSVLMPGGTGSKVTIDNTRRRAIDSIYMSVTAEFPAVQRYIEEHPDELEYLLYSDGMQLQLKLDIVRAMTDFDMGAIDSNTDSFIRDYINWFNTATTASWDLEAPGSKAYALKDTNGNLHAAFAEIEPGKIIVPFIRIRSGVTNPNELELLLFKFEEGHVTAIYLTDDAGNRRIIRANELKTELQLMPALTIDEFVRTRVLPISASSFTVTPQNVDDIELVYTDISNISDIGDADGDGNAFNITYEVADIYGSRLDITETVNNPVGELVSMALVKVQDAEYTGEELAPQVTYNGKTLVEGEDYEWTRNDNDDPIVLPGEYGITLVGSGKYTDMAITTFTVNPTPEDMLAAFEAEEKITAALALATTSALESGDAVALAAVDEALAIYNGLTEAQQTQIDRKVLKALLAASQKATSAKTAAASAAAKRTDLSKATVSVAKATYTGKALKPKVSVTLGGKKLKAGTDYTVTYVNNKKAGTGVAVVKGTGSYAGAAVKTFKINKAKNPLSVKAKKPKVKRSKTKKANVKLAVKKAIAVSKAKGKTTYKKVKGNKKITIAKNGRITVKKGIKKGTYKVKVKVTAAGTTNYKKRSKTVTFKLKVA